MPELPEVETIARQLRARGIEGRCIEQVEINWEKTMEPLSGAAFCEALIGKTLETITRYGKWMMFTLGSGRTIMIHLRMSGSFSMAPGTHDRIILTLSGGTKVYFSDPRKFGRWKLVDDPARILGALGPDALTKAFTLKGFREALLRRKRILKPVLLDQTVVAGLGNIYVDEALWESRIHPERICCSLSDDETELLYKAIRHVLQVGVQNRGTSLGEGRSNYRDVDGDSGGYREKVKAYGRGGRPCHRCGTLLEKRVVAQRGTTFCPVCQPENA